MRSAPMRPISRHAATSSVWIARASAHIAAWRAAPGSLACAAPRSRQRRTAHARFTAVGRAASSTAPAARVASTYPAAPCSSAARAASAMPYAAEMPIAGAPRTTMSRIAFATSLDVVSVTYASRAGRSRCSRSHARSPSAESSAAE